MGKRGTACAFPSDRIKEAKNCRLKPEGRRSSGVERVACVDGTGVFLLFNCRLFSMIQPMSTVWSFDLGKGSIGEAVRDVKTNQFLHVESLLIPAEFASTKDATKRRRFMRTRLAHKMREQWLDEVWRKAGQEPLIGRRVGKVDGKWKLISKGDKRLEREFPEKGDPTCYTSCVLRIKLLRGEKLEPWQIYKALHSAIQRRGYDPKIPWKSRESRSVKTKETDEEDKGTLERMNAFQKELHGMIPDRGDLQLPCYFDAWKMGLWNPAEPDTLKERIDCHAGTTRNVIIPRELIEKEIHLLADKAGKQIEGLAGKANELLYGPSQTAYASYFPELRQKHHLREGGANDWQGVLGQKIPRFDNRIIEKCVLMPRFNVCKIRSDDKGQPLPDSRIIFDAVFLMKLKNMRVQREPKVQTALTAAEIKTIFEDPKRTSFKVTETQWKKICKTLGVLPQNGFEEIEAPKPAGRSRFCRPALEVMKRLILSGLKPAEFLTQEVQILAGNTNPQKGLVPADLKFLQDTGSTWEGIYIPNQRLEALVNRSEDRDAAIQEIIGANNDPIVRHRLNVFVDRLRVLEKAHGQPEEVVIEFVREDYMGKKALIEYRKFLKTREADRKRAREEAASAGATDKGAGMKIELLRLQGGECLYTGAKLCPSKLDEYQIDHIVPRSRGGPDAMVNYILTTREANKEKDNKTPFEWLSATAGWDAYKNRVNGYATALRRKKVMLLTGADACELADKYTALAETAWIAKLSQTIVGVFFGWKNGVDAEGRKRVTIISGGLTARIRRKYGLNTLLAGEGVTEEEAEKKNRADDRHHALDAMVINFIPGWARDEEKLRFFRFPPTVNKETFAKYLNNTLPRNLCLEKPVLAETVYGLRGGAERVIVQRAILKDLAYKSVGPSKFVYDLTYARKQFDSVRDARIKSLLIEWADKKEGEQQWLGFCKDLRVPRKDGTQGSRVLRVLMDVGGAEEYRDLSKDGSGAWRKAKKGHRGQIIYLDGKGVPRVRPIYVFESPAIVAASLKKQGTKTIGFFQSGCTVSVSKEVAHAKMPLPAGIYLLNSIRTGGDVKLTRQDGRTHPDIPRYSLAALVKAGFTRT